MSAFGLYAAPAPNSGRAKCQICQQLIAKAEPALTIIFYFNGKRAYLHGFCVAGVVDEAVLKFARQVAA